MIFCFVLFSRRTGLVGLCFHICIFPSPKSWVHTARPVFPDSQFPDRQDKRRSLATPLYIPWGFRLVVMFCFFTYPLLGPEDNYTLSTLLPLYLTSGIIRVYSLSCDSFSGYFQAPVPFCSPPFFSALPCFPELRSCT